MATYNGKLASRSAKYRDIGIAIAAKETNAAGVQQTLRILKNGHA